MSKVVIGCLFSYTEDSKYPPITGTGLDIFMLSRRYADLTNEQLCLFTDSEISISQGADNSHIREGYLAFRPKLNIIQKYADFEAMFQKMDLTADTIIFYFGGHATENREYVFPDGPVHISIVDDLLYSRIHSRQSLIIVQDCCHGPQRELPYISADGVIVKRTGHLRKQSCHTMVLSSTHPHQKAASSNLMGSLFTYYLFQYLHNPTTNDHTGSMFESINGQIYIYDDTREQHIFLQSNYRPTRIVPKEL